MCSYSEPVYLIISRWLDHLHHLPMCLLQWPCPSCPWILMSLPLRALALMQAMLRHMILLAHVPI
jgi:hypothetical protein